MTTPTLDTITLAHGSHQSREAGMCAMEAAAYLAGEPHSDHPECVSPAIAALLRIWNNALPDDDTRDRLLKPLVPLSLNTATGPDDEQARAWLATDWLVRTYAPAWLRLAGLTEHADNLTTLQPIANAAYAASVQGEIDAARDAAWEAAEAAAEAATRAASGAAARAATEAAARDAAGAAAWAATWAAARDASGAAARAAAEAAARAAAREAAEAAAREQLALTVTELQSSAQDLVQRMCEVGRPS